MALPLATVPAIRAALVSQGFPANTIGDDGSIDPARLLSGVYDTIEFRSRASPTVEIKTAELSSNEPSGWIPRLTMPAVIFRGRAGVATIAPYGVPSKSTGLAVTIGLVVGLVGIGYWLGRR